MHKKINIKKFLSEKRKKSRGKYKKAIFIKKRTRMGIEKLSDFVYSKTKRNKSLNKGGPTIMKKKKLISLLLVASMAFSLAACGSSGGDDKDADKGGDEKTLKVAAVETAYGPDMWKEVCSAFEKSHEGVKVELTIDKKLEDVINPQMKSGEYPDVILRAVGAESGITETFVKDNNLVDLTDVLDMTVPGEEVTVGDKILPGFVENTITNPYGDGKTYLMPMFYGPCGLFYNAGLFEEKGWDVPTTWDEMWALGDKAKEEGIALFTYPTTGYFDAFFYALMHETMGDDFSKALTYEDGIWDTEGAKQAFDIVAKLATYTEKTTPANANDNDFRKNQQLVLDNKALFMPNGNWVIGEMEDAPKADGFEWGFTALPAVKEGGERASYTFFEQIWMPAEAKEQDLGKEFIAYLYSDEAAKIFFDKGGAVQPIEGMSDMITDDNTKLYYSIYDTGAVAVMDAFAATEPIEGLTTRSTFFDPVNSLVTGDKTEQDWIDQIKAEQPHLIILDIKLPGTSGFSLCTEIRTFSEVPIIFVTSCNTDMDELNSIMLGGDAFITKPYNTAILLAKIASLLKKAYPTQQREQMVYGDAVLRLESSSLDYHGQSVELTKNELKILYYLFKNGGKICSRGDMIEYLWDNQLYVDDNALSVNINRIREKLAGIGLTDFIKTKHRQGYTI